MANEKLEEAFSFLRDNLKFKYILILIADISNKMSESLNIAIVGATGYIGLELIKILSKHKKVKILYLCATKSIGENISKFDSKIKKKGLPKISKIENINWDKIKLIFTALPNGGAHAIANKLPNNVKLIDLSGDFRLKDHKLFKKWYGIKHKSIKLIKKSKYALTEFSKKDLSKYKIISCPGCYPTSIQLALIPLVEKKLIKTNNIIIDSKSGYSGGGKNIKKKFKFKNLLSSVTSYGVGYHRHMAELDQELTKVSKNKIKVTFTPHLIPMFRGILSTIYVECTKRSSAKKIYIKLKKYHKKNVFVKIAKFGENISTGEVINTNLCKISVFQNREKNHVIITSVIDNLLKGGSGQAVQNMNVAYKFKETTGLL